MKNKLNLVHKLKGRKSNFKSRIKRKEIVQKYLDSLKIITNDKKAEPYNFSYFVKYKLKNIMKENLIVSPSARKSTKKAYNKILKSRIKELKNKKTKLIKKSIEINKKNYFRKSRIKNEGLIQEINASKDNWFNDKYSYLHASYDPATKKITALHIEKEETTKDYFNILNKLINKGKLSQKFKGDFRPSFVINKKNAEVTAHKDVNTQFGFVLNILGIKWKIIVNQLLKAKLNQ